jgi:hypothetical protein
MDIAEAQAVLQAEADKLTNALRRKGYVDAHCEIWINRNGTGVAMIYVATWPIMPGSNLYLPSLIRDARAQIMELPFSDAMAYADEFNGPLWLMSEHP